MAPFDDTKSDKQLWPLEKLQAYFSHCKRLRPRLTDMASAVLTRYYQRQRQSDRNDAARTTVRLLQSSIRLAEGHARLMCRQEVEAEDAVWAVLLLESSTASASEVLASDNSPLHTSFPDDPVEDYRKRAREVLVRES